MEKIQAPKKERKFLKAVGNIAKVLANELVMGIARKFIGKAIDKVGNKRQGLVIALVMVAGVSYAAIDSIPYPITGNKQKLGWQTSGNGLVYRGRAADTITKPSNYTNKDIKAYLLVDTVNNVMYSYIASKGGWKFNNSDTVIIQGVTMPFDSITFNTAKDGTVGVGEVEYNDTQGSLIQGLKGGNVTNVIGQQLHQRVNNRTGATLTKGTAVYLSGSQGNRITVAKALGVTDAFSANTFGIVAESIANNQSGYVITEGLITNINTSSLVEDSAVYLSPTVAGGLTSTKPQAPQHTVYIGVCVKSNAGSGELFCKIRNGQELNELHDVRITSPVDKASLYYKSSEGLWRDTTAALLVSDTASMLTPYFKDADTTSLNLTSRFAAKLNISDTASMLTNYLRTGAAASTYQTILTNPITGTGTINYIPKFTSTGSTIGSSGLINDVNFLFVNPNSQASFGWDYMTNTSNPFIGSNVKNGTSNERIQKAASSTLFNPSAIIFGYQRVNNSSGAVSFGGINFVTTSGNPVGDINPIDFTRMFIDPNGNIGIGTMQPSYNLDIQGTLNVTGATTLSAPFTVNSSAVFNEGSTDSDFRVESDGNVNMVFVDASTNRVGIGTNAPSKTLEVSGTFNATGDITEGGNNVLTNLDTASLSSRIDLKLNKTDTASLSNRINGKVSLTGDEYINGQKTFGGLIIPSNGMQLTATGNNSNKLIGINASSFVGEVTLGTGLTLTSNVLNVNDASTIASGVVNTTTQSFAGNKTFTGTLDVSSTGTFGGRVKTNWLERNYAYSTSSSFTVSVNTTWQDINTNVLTTLTLPNPATYPGKEIHIRQTGSGSLQSASSNIIPFQTPPTGSTSTAILLASTHEAVTLVSDGTNWIIMQRSEN